MFGLTIILACTLKVVVDNPEVNVDVVIDSTDGGIVSQIEDKFKNKSVINDAGIAKNSCIEENNFCDPDSINQ